jgi:heme-degrading monooxygenase HmoA
MYARSTTIHGNPGTLDEGIGYVRDEVMPAVTGMEGCVGLSMLVDRESGDCIVTTSWRDEEAMRSSAEGVRSMRERAAEMFGGATPEVREWEIAVLHRAHEAGEGACTRVTWSRTDPAQAERVLDGYRMSVMPKLEEMPGFCSVSVLVSRNEGMAATAVTYKDRQSLEQTRETARAMRDEFAPSMGVAITDVREYELALAHLRVPETV